MPLEQVVDIPILQFPALLAFAATANELALGGGTSSETRHQPRPQPRTRP